MSAVGSTNRWTRCRRPRPGASLRLICFPHAGGSASFFTAWADLLPTEIELHAVQYPGRQDRVVEPLIDDMDRLVSSVREALDPLLDRPVALFGHSMGAAVAFELARLLPDSGPGALRRLLVSGREAPPLSRPGDVHLRDDLDVVAELRRYGMIGEELLTQPDLRRLLLPPVRGDYRLIETYRFRPGPPLTCPITAHLGASDDDVTSAEMRAWAAQTTGPFELAMHPGGHFFLVDGQPELVAAVADVLSGDVLIR